jgi:osmotically inducible protein OsmC
MTHLDKVLYTAKAHTTGGRDGGASRTSDGHLDVKLSTWHLGAAAPTRNNCSLPIGRACFLSAIDLAADKMKVALPADVAIDSEVDLNLADGGYFLSRPSQHQPAGCRAQSRPGPGRRSTRDLSILNRDTRQH